MSPPHDERRPAGGGAGVDEDAPIVGALAFARALIDHGVPVFLAQADPTQDTGFRLPPRWQHTKCTPRVLEHWKAGMALCAVGGHGIDFVDVDPRNGGDVAAKALREDGRWPTVYAVVHTPSPGGTHDYVFGLGIAKTKRDGIDLQAGAPDGSGRGFVFLPGTVRGPNARDKPQGPYVLESSDLSRFGRDEATGASIRSWFQEPGAPSSPFTTRARANHVGVPIPRGEHDSTLAAFVASLAKAGTSRSRALAAWRVRVADCVGADPKWPFTEDDFDRHRDGAMAKYRPAVTGPSRVCHGYPPDPQPSDLQCHGCHGCTGYPVHLGGGLLDAVHGFVTRFVAFETKAQGDAVTMWAAHTHLAHQSDSTPRIAFLSPEPGSGKTRALEVLSVLVASPMHALSASPAALFRSLGAGPRTILLDEVDAVFGRKAAEGSEDLRALLNAGHRRGATIPRCVGKSDITVTEFPVYAPVALAGLGDLPDTIISRSVVVRMRRRLSSQPVEPYRARINDPEGHELRDALACWASRQDTTTTYPTLPDWL